MYSQQFYIILNSKIIYKLNTYNNISIKITIIII